MGLKKMGLKIPETSKRLASVGLLVSGSHDSGEIACNLMVLFVDMLFMEMRYAH